MKKRNKVIWVAVLCVLISVSIAACGFHRSPEEKADYVVNKMSKQFELDDAQKANLDTLKQDLLSMREAMKGKKAETHQTIENIFAGVSLDQQQALELVHQHTAQVNEQAPVLIAKIADFYDSLNEEQQAMLREKIKAHDKHRGHWFH